LSCGQPCQWDSEGGDAYVVHLCLVGEVYRPGVSAVFPADANFYSWVNLLGGGYVFHKPADALDVYGLEGVGVEDLQL
jgi:hypothetical protein